MFQVFCTYGYMNKISDIFFTSLMCLRFHQVPPLATPIFMLFYTAVYYWCYLLAQTRLLVFHADIFPVLLYCRLFANTQAESYMHMDLVCSSIFSSTYTTAFIVLCPIFVTRHLHYFMICILHRHTPCEAIILPILCLNIISLR